MSVLQVLSLCNDKAVQLKLDGERLRLVGNKEAIDEQLISLTRNHKAQLIEILRTRQAAPGEPPLVALAAPQRLQPQVASFNQQRLWFLQQLGDRSSYNGGIVLELEGELERDALQLAIDQLVQRHESLRTRFVEIDGLPQQQVHLDVRVAIEQCSLAADGQQQALGAVVAEPFDLGSDTLLRVRLYRRSEHSHVLLFVTHHITGDAWSQQILLEDFCELYAAAVAKRRAALAAPTLQYLDYARWERARLQGALLAEKLGIWRSYLQGAPAIHCLPTDAPRPLQLDRDVALFQQSLPAVLTQQLGRIAAGERTTLFTVLAAAYAGLLSRLSDCHDIIVGMPVANRTRPEIEGVCGYFANTVVLRTDACDDPSFLELVQRTRANLEQVLSHQDVPFDVLVDDLRVRRSLTVSPLYQLWFSWRETPTAQPQLTNLQARARTVDHSSGRYDLKLELHQQGEQLVAHWEYKTSLYRQATIARFADCFERLLHGVTHDPRQALRRIALHDPEPVRLTVADDAGGMDLLACWQSAVRERPEGCAVRSASVALSFASAEQKSNRLAALLHESGVGPGSKVGVVAEQSLESVLALLAVWKLGAIYVPLDAGMGHQQLERVLAAADIELLLVSAAQAEALAFTNVELLVLQDVAAESWLVDYSAQALPAPRRAAHDVVCLSYHMAAEAAPDSAVRGIALSRTNLQQYAQGIAGALQLPSALSFACCWPPGTQLGDALVFLALQLGGELQIIPPEVMSDPARAHGHLAGTAADVWLLTPSYLEALWAAHGRIAPRRALLTAGEVLGASLQRELYAAGIAPACRVLHLFGTVPTSLVCCAWELPDRPAAAANLLGRMLGCNRALILQGDARAPQGAWGELAIAGPCLAQTYGEPQSHEYVELNTPEGTSTRIHRTGLRARLDAAGTLVFGGSLADSIGARAIRDELSEVELVLRKLPSVRAATVTVQPTGEILAHALCAVDSTVLLQQLAAAVPGHLLPKQVFTSQSLPLDSQGRFDWLRVLHPAVAPLSTPTSSSDTQAVLCEIWCELLGRAQIGPADHFFECGGHSLLATRLLNRIRARLCAELTLPTLFQYPVLGDLARHIDARIAERDAQCDAQDAASYAVLPPISSSPESAACLSFGQQQLWLVDRIEQGSSHYNMVAGYLCTGELDRAALAASIDRLVERHRVLRTRFVERAGEVRQLVADAVTVPLLHLDWTHLDGVQQCSDVDALMAREASFRFDLTADTLLRVTLVTLGAHSTLLVLNVHHIACDGWSVSLLLQELRAFYTAEVSQQPSQLAPLAVQYTDYARWQREVLSGERLEVALQFWRTLLADAPPLHEIPTDRPRPALLEHAGAEWITQLEPTRFEQLQQLASSTGTTLFICLESIVALFFARLGVANDVVLGTPVSGRYHADVEPLIGLFVNMLPLRHRIEGDPEFLSYLAASSAMVGAALSHQYCPFERLVDELSTHRSLDANPIFQLVFALKQAAAKRIELPGVEAVPLERRSLESKFDLMLSAVESEGELRLEWQYSMALFDRATVARLAAQFDAFLSAVLGNPRARISQLSLLSPQDRALIELALAGGAPSTTDLYSCFMQAAAANPAQIALDDGVRRLSYADLERSAQNVAAHLWERGVRPGDRVGLYLPRSVDFISCLFGIVRLGAAYVPLDINYPLSRTRRILEDAQLALLIAAPETLPQLQDLSGTVICCTELHAPAANPLPAIDIGPETLAYLMYTSGSTGTPKGVMVPHRAILRLVRNCSFMPLAATTVMLQAAPVAFDASTLEIFGPLLNGGRLVIHTAAELEPAQLVSFVEQHRINSLWLTAALFEQWVRHVDRPLPDLKHVVTGGDVVPVHAVQRLYEALPQVTIINGYGPTENTTFTCCYTIPRDWPARPVPIGRPIAGTGVVVLDAWGQPRPIGAVGELYACGPGLALGYWRNAALTSEVFGVAAGGQPLYRTGDLVRWDGDGVLHYLGRADSQVKIRGFRVELGEVERCLLGEPAIQEVCALVLGEERQLVAYFTRRAQLQQTAAELRAALRQRALEQLPAVMVPVAWVELPSLPVNANGKLERRALPKPQQSDFISGDYVAPEGELEHLFAAIWAQLLGFARVGVRDDFFALGGNSLLATRMASAVEAATGQRLPLREVFQRGSIRELAKWLSTLPVRSTHTPIARRAHPGPVTASFAQQRLWFIDQVDGGSSQYNMPALFELQGAVDRRTLQIALDRLVARHAVLRTTYAEVGGVAMQHVAPTLTQPIQYHDLRGMTPGVQQQHAHALLEQDARAQFDLQRGPVFRVTLVRLAEAEYRLLLNMHHIASDGWSVAVLIRDLMSLYGSAVAGEADALPALPIQYTDYAEWQRTQLSTERRAALLAYWREQLQGIVPLHSLPTDRPRPARITTRGATLRTALDPQRTQQLKALAQQHSVSMFTLLQASFALLLARIGAQRDIVFGTPVAGRERAELEALVGCFVNTLVLRNQVPEQATFAEYLAQSRAMVLDAMEHQELPFDMLVEDLNPARSASHLPLFQLWFVWQNMEMATLALPGLQATELRRNEVAAKFDLMLSAQEAQGGIACSWVYNTDLFEAATIQSWCDSFAVLIDGILANPDAPLAQLPLVSRAQAALLDHYASGGELEPQRLTVSQQFARAADLHPERTAIRYLEETLSYGALQERAGRLAGYLSELGIGPGDCVGICCERSVELLIAVLGVWQSGAAFVPLDPKSPPQRLAFVVADTNARLLLVSRDAAELFDLSKVDVLLLQDAGRDQHWLQEFSGREDRSVANALAYIIYTSGTTGRPKGVMVTHASLMSLGQGLDQIFVKHGCSGPLRWAWNAPLIFDAALQALTQLGHGSELHLLSDQMRTSPPALLEYLEQQRIELLDCTPSLLQVLMREAVRQERPLPHLLVGGEPIHAKQWQQIAESMARHGRVAVNVYGPTETTVDATFAVIAAGSEPNIGRPLAGVEVRVLDANLLPVPLGAVGECCIGGCGVAPGYLNQPELTAAKFIELQRDGTTQRYYRSGDLVRWSPRGELLFLGRRDTQVKLRGYRIELAEVEQVVRGVPGVTAAAVVLLEQSQTLVAYSVCAGAHDARAIEAECRRRLPEYMVPSAFVPLERIPLTRNGKLDVRALPAPQAVAEVHRAALTDPTQRALQALWQRTLATTAIGADDDFFVLGGHSLLAVRVVSAIREELEVELPLAALFKHPTIAGLAAVIAGLERKRMLPPIRSTTRTGNLPLSFAQRRLWLIDKMEGGSPQYNMPAAFQLRGTLDVAACRGSIDHIVQRHEILRTVYLEVNGQPVQRICARAEVPFTILDLSHPDAVSQAHAVNEVVRADAAQPFDLRREPILRVHLLKLAEQEHVLVFNMHHIASDGWSITLLIKEFLAGYAALASGADYAPLPLPIQYGDYALWQQQWQGLPQLADELAYWRQHLQGLPLVHSLPLDKPRPSRQAYRGECLLRRLPQDTHAALQRLSLAADVTLFVTLQAALAALLARWSNEADIVVGTPVAGRDQQSLEPLIGFFLNTLVIRNDVSGNPSFAQLLERTRRTVLAAFEHRHVPFEMLIDALRPERSLSHPPLFQVMFVLQNQEQAEMRLPSIELAPVERTQVVAKFDLLLNIKEVSAKDAADGLELAWTYNTDLFNADTIARLADGFEQILTGIIADLNTPLAALRLLPPAAMHTIVHQWNQTSVDLPHEQLLHELFMKQVVRTPDATAVVDADGALTYLELCRQALTLARVLQPHLHAPESLVGVLLPKGRGQLVATLAIMMAGGAYLPLDTQWPPSRNAQILAHGEACALVTLSSLADAVQLPIPCICSDTLAPAEIDVLAACREFRAPQGARSLAYVIFTSGSTGTPKGVAIEHRSAVNTLLDINQRYAVTAADSVLAVSALSFDLSVYDMFGLLAVGGRVVFPEDLRQKDPAHWAELVDRHGITLWDSVPASAELLTAHHEFRRLQGSSSLRLVMMSGDWIPPTLPRRLWSVFAGAQLHSLGGATEAAIWSISYPILGDMSQYKSVPYGKPLANQSFHVLSDDLEPCPVGVAGQLFIGGIGVAREYYHDPQRTAHSFIQHPRLGMRIYRTGDVGRYLPDGNIEFLGRKDHQVKIRGFRIELGEIEAALTAHPEIECAVVMALPDPTGVTQLVAYLTLANQATRGAYAASTLRNQLASVLPSYMVPAYYVLLERWPLSANNKIDRKQLPPPAWRAAGESVTAPANATEQMLLELWQQVLNRSCIDTTQNFFEAGGTSVHLIEIANRANALLQQEISVVNFFQQPTIVAMAKFILQRSAAQSSAAQSSELHAVKREKQRLTERRLRRK
jgi:amino acid adenylation domain-containing protein